MDAELRLKVAHATYARITKLYPPNTPLGLKRRVAAAEELTKAMATCREQFAQDAMYSGYSIAFIVAHATRLLEVKR